MSFLNRKIGPPDIEEIEQEKEYYNQIHSDDYPVEKYIPIYKIIISYMNSIGLDKKIFLICDVELENLLIKYNLKSLIVIQVLILVRRQLINLKINYLIFPINLLSMTATV